MKKMILVGAVLLSISALAIPVVSDVAVRADAANCVKITYRLTGGPAVVTLDVQTNSTCWASIGGAALFGAETNKVRVTGDVFRKVTGEGPHMIVWNAYRAWGALGGAFQAGQLKFVVKAHPLDDTPDYLVTDLRAGVAAADRITYYPSEDFLPGGLLSNLAYRTTHLVLRRMHARNVRFTMGATTGSSCLYEPKETSGKKYAETVHRVTLANDYYIGVFEITQAQWKNVTGVNKSFYKYSPESPLRPAEQVSYARLREAAYDCSEADGNASHPDYAWPRAPHGDSFLGKLRTLTGDAIDYDLPGDIEWEFACRAGLPEGYWNDGSDAKDLTLMPGRNNVNGGFLPGGTSYPAISTLGPTNGTAVCGSYAPNRWGLYDMHGNVQEWCLDWYQDSYLNSAVNVSPTDPTKTLSGGAATLRCRRGGSFVLPPFAAGSSNDCRASARAGLEPGKAYVNLGGRVACRGGLK